MLIVRIGTNVVNAYIDQAALPGALKNAGFKVRWEYIRQQGKHLKLHG
jgi:hypothetical protein